MFVAIHATPVPETKIKDPNNIRHYITREAIDDLESSIKISSDLSEVFFLMWTPENGVDNFLEFDAGVDPQVLLDANFDPTRPTKFLSHGWNSHADGYGKPFIKGIIA